MDDSPLTENLKKEFRIFERTIQILCIIEREAPLGITRLSQRLEMPEHKVRYSLRMLQRKNLIKPTSKGAVLTKKHGDFKKHIFEVLENIKNKVSSLEEELEE